MPENIDFNLLRELIEKSAKKPAPTPEEQKIKLLKELDFDRTTAGILITRLEESRLKEEPENKPEKELTEAQKEEQLKEDTAVFRRDVVLGRWDRVRDFLKTLPEDKSQEAFKMIVEKLARQAQVSPPPELVAQGAKPHSQPQFMPPMDLLGLMGVSTAPPDKELIKMLAGMLSTNPRPPGEFLEKLEEGITNFGGTDADDRERAAEFLLDVKMVKDAEAFLPDLEESREKKDYEALNLIARHRVMLMNADKKAAGKDALPLAWELSTSFLTDTKASPEARAEALSRSLLLIPELGDDTGREWLEKTFSDSQGEGLELLASLGTLIAQSRDNPDEKIRLEQLKLQSAAVNAILSTENIDAAVWSEIFTLFARQWNHEARITQQRDQSTSRRTQAQYDPWGNVFYNRSETQYYGQGARPITTGEMLECMPEENWLSFTEESTRNATVLAATRLFLKVKEESKAMPLMKTLAAADKDKAKALVREMIRVWTENHNPNDEQDNRSRYFYFYGYNQQSGTIPLTRSKQERNLVELAALVKGIHELDLGETFHEELAEAFISCHSKAEVWRVEAIESVFGTTDALNSATLATLVGRMRLNLAGLWPSPKLQQTYKTNRKDNELQEQILYGYSAASGILERALLKKPNDAWMLKSQLAALRFEESNYQSSIAPDHEHSAIKRASLDALAAAAAEYAATLPMDDQSKETTSVFETWFFGALGSPSLEALKSHHVANPEEYGKIKAALESLSGDCKERHLKAFATTLNTRLANVSPDLKLRFLEGSEAVAGDHEAMADASEVLAYYRDLVTEIQLDAAIDGSAKVGSTSPFGLRVNIRHTREIERESGGFQKYLQNQANSPYGFNYGRPPEDYRDKFEKAARAVLEEHFEVVSLTYHSDKVESLTDPEHGWRVTPYAYFLLKPKGPQVDKVPPLKIDLDFTDTSGYVVLPISSGEVLIDSAQAAPRPYRDLRVTQTLDERSEKEKGSLFLEVKATALGLVPPLDELIDLESGEFETGAIEDRMLRVVELDAASEDLAPLSEHEWRIELKPGGGTLPAAFHFPAVKPEVADDDGIIRQRYVDVDLVPVSEVVALGGESKRSIGWIAGGFALIMVVGAGVFLFVKSRKKPIDDGPALLPLPEHISAVSVIGYLRRLQEREGISENLREAISNEIVSLEDRHFGREDAAQDPDALEEIAKRWQAA